MLAALSAASDEEGMMKRAAMDAETMIPKDKSDIDTALAIVDAGGAADAALLEWVQDLNWPVARVLAPFLASAGAVVAPGIRDVFASDDDTWKSSIINGVVARSQELIQLLRPELQRIADMPTAGERLEGLDLTVEEMLTNGIERGCGG